LNSDTFSSGPQAAPIHILLVEDNKIDVRLTCHAFHQMTDWPSDIQVLDDGETAMNFLHGLSAADHKLPDLVILDLNLPKYDGMELLQFIRSSAVLRNLLVFIFSSSPVDITRQRMQSGRVMADSYFEKPNEVGTFYSIAAAIRAAYQNARLARRGATA
jgi:CheY-like chemotaxis protein